MSVPLVSWFQLLARARAAGPSTRGLTPFVQNSTREMEGTHR